MFLRYAPTGKKEPAGRPRYKELRGKSKSARLPDTRHRDAKCAEGGRYMGNTERQDAGRMPAVQKATDFGCVVLLIDRGGGETYTAGMGSNTELVGALRRYWGYDSFRPLQEKIVRSLLEGHDNCVVMPTGGGKSLCYQLPAAMTPGRTVMVISPLIALMQDQVAQLTQMGIPAALLNSSLMGREQTEVMQRAREGAFRLLYISPERLARPETIAWLRQVPISFFAIDEAHCISEWGHEFRPEYRQLSCLRQNFPERPIAAFTASATQRVRHDIIEQLQLREPGKHIASFHRRNLRYIVRECAKGTQPELLLRALRNYEGSNVIVYAPTIARVEETVDWLEEQGIAAIAYHGKMEAGERRRNQERWMSDEVRVLVGTIAFGLGINKAAVRAVIHLSLPKSIEQFYQEAGRAGRDGLEADCVLLWQKQDPVLLKYFANQFTDPVEKQRALQRFYEVRDFVERKNCRHRQICAHFGEKVKWEVCDACDACGCKLAWLAEAEAEAPATAVAVQPAYASKRSAMRVDGGEVDAQLREYLREWRSATAKEQDVPAFVVMHDTTLDEVCRVRPTSLAQVRGISGFGERKTERYGPGILEALKRFRAGERAAAAAKEISKPAEETIRLLAEGRTFEEIAQIRGRQLSTIEHMVADLVRRGELKFQAGWIDAAKVEMIEAACARLGCARLAPLKEALPAEITFGEIRIVVARLRSAPQQRKAAAASGRAS
jgi:ATP-dependent DNA helicase RecQ